jgi:hypothetical protein
VGVAVSPDDLEAEVEEEMEMIFCHSGLADPPKRAFARRPQRRVMSKAAKKTP